MTASVPGKRQVLLAYLESGVAMVHLDARRPGVSVPQQYRNEAHLRLNLSYRYGIPDLVIDDARVQATLSFGGRSFQCVLPWQAIFGITSQESGDGQVWPEDLPVEVTAEAEQALQPVESGPRRPSLAAVETDTSQEEPRKAPEGNGKGHLRLGR